MANEQVRVQNVRNVLCAAHRCFIQSGIENTTLDLIAREAGVSLRSLNRYFVSKSDLVLETLRWSKQNDCCASEEEQRRFEQLLNSRKTGDQLLQSYIDLLIRLYRENPQVFLVRSEMEQYLFRNQLEQSAACIAARSAIMGRPVLREIFRRGQADRTLYLQTVVDEEIAYFNNVIFSFFGTLAANSRAQPALSGQEDQQLVLLEKRLMGCYTRP